MDQQFGVHPAVDPWQRPDPGGQRTQAPGGAYQRPEPALDLAAGVEQPVDPARGRLPPQLQTAEATGTLPTVTRTSGRPGVPTRGDQLTIAGRIAAVVQPVRVVVRVGDDVAREVGGGEQSPGHHPLVDVHRCHLTGGDLAPDVQKGVQLVPTTQSASPPTPRGVRVARHAADRQRLAVHHPEHARPRWGGEDAEEGGEKSGD